MNEETLAELMDCAECGENIDNMCTRYGWLCPTCVEARFARLTARVAELEAALAESDALCDKFRLTLTSIADDPLVSDIASRVRSWEPDLTDARMSAAIALGRDPADILRTKADEPGEERL